MGLFRVSEGPLYMDRNWILFFGVYRVVTCLAQISGQSGPLPGPLPEFLGNLVP